MLKLYTWCRPPAPQRAALPPLAPGISTLRFGHETLLYTEEEPPSFATHNVTAARGPSSGRGTRLPQRYVDATPANLHLVVQNGRLFQQHHPGVPVLHDRGRFLLVSVDPARAAELADPHGTCWGIRPLASEAVVFDAPEPVAPGPGPDFAKLAVDRLQRTRYMDNLERLVGFGTRHSTSPQFAAASDWAHRQLEDFGYSVEVQRFEIGTQPSCNVIAERSPSPHRPVLLVTAHLDSINQNGGPLAAAPGADDNGSGSAGLLEVARVLKDHRGECDLRCVLFGGEEQGLLGSQRYVEQLSGPERQRIHAVINMDMIGTLNDAKRSVLLEGGLVSQPLIDALHVAASTYTELEVETSLHPYASDHVPFIRAGIPAVLTIEGTDSANPNIHSERDTLSHIDAELSLEILRMIVGFVAEALGPTGV